MERHGFAEWSVPGVFLVHDKTHYRAGCKFQGVESIANPLFKLSGQRSLYQYKKVVI
jgi:hypothetical protein